MPEQTQHLSNTLAVVVDRDDNVAAVSGRGRGLVESPRIGQPLSTVAPRLAECRPAPCQAAVIEGRDGSRWSVLVSTTADQGRLLLATRDESLDAPPDQPAGLSEPFALAASVLANVANGVLITDTEAKIAWSNEAVSRITGFSRDDLVGQYPTIFGSGRHNAEFFKDIWNDLWTHGHWEGEIWNRRKSGEVYPEWLTISAFRQGQDIIGWIGVFSDLSTVRGSDEKLLKLAHHDPLTGLPNRLLLNDRIEHALQQARRRGHRVGVLFVDLDHFKPINDSLGHEVGDSVLRTVAERLTERLRSEDTVARLGGDEFIVVIDPLDRENHAARVARDIIARIREPLTVTGGGQVSLGASIGVARFPDDAHDATELLRLADTAMYSAKQAGGNTFRFWKPELTLAAEQKLRLEEDLREAIGTSAIQVWYQPVFHMTGGGVEGIEAVVRWTHPNAGLLHPQEFLTIAEHSGLILELGQQMRRTALEDFARLRKEGHTDLHLVLNMSGTELAAPEGVNELLAHARASDVDPRHLRADIAEKALRENFDQTHNQLLTLHRAGVQLQLDDFGAGQLALANLMRIPFRSLKLDRRLVMRLPDDEDARRLCSLTTTVARHQDLGVCAVGIENRQQAMFLDSIGVTSWQGFLGARPMPVDKLKDLGFRPFLVHQESVDDGS